MTLSVIIPIYKTELTLDRCVESVLSQNVNDMEVILVDDGSPDDCPTLCDKWAEHDKRIIVIHKQNGGLSDARNAGVDIACGDYITFVDSDDYLSDNTYEPLMYWLHEHVEIDILEYSIKVTGGTRTHTKYKDVTYNNAKDYWLYSKAWNHAYAWNKIYRRSIFNNSRYKPGRMYEDLLLLPLLLKKAGCVATTSKGQYNYCLHDDGISMTTNRTNITQLLEAELRAALNMHTHPFSRNGWQLYKSMVYRIVDIVKSFFRHD